MDLVCDGYIKKGQSAYLVIPKYSLSEFSKLNSNNANFFIKDKDPIIGWNFENSGDNVVDFEINDIIDEIGTVKLPYLQK